MATETAKKKPVIFDILDAINLTKEPINFSDPEVDQAYSVMTINRWISSIEGYIPVVQQFNRLDIPKHIHALALQNILPKKQIYCKYPKSPKKERDFEKRYIAHYYSCSLAHAEQYLDILSSKTVEEILETYKYGAGKMRAV